MAYKVSEENLERQRLGRVNIFPLQVRLGYWLAGSCNSIRHETHQAGD